MVSSGVDPLLTHYKYISDSCGNQKTQRWVSAGHINPHSHDVRAITLARDMVISGGEYS